MKLVCCCCPATAEIPNEELETSGWVSTECEDEVLCPDCAKEWGADGWD